MKLIRKRENWGRYAVKMGVVLGCLIVAGVAFASRYKIGIDPQNDRCLPDYIVYLIDKQDKSLARGQIYAFSARGLSPFYEDGTTMVKILQGMPGDAIEIDEALDVTVNQQVVGQGLALVEQLQRKPADFIGSMELPSGNYWFMGENPRSFDSRYWGTVKEEQVIGRAYPLF